MCAVSVLSQYGRDRVRPEQWNRGNFADFQDIIRRLEALDRKLDQPDCVDPEKAEWMKAIEQRLATLEQPKA